MAERSSFSDGGELELLVLLPDQRSVRYSAHSNCPMMDLLIQIASKENLKPSAYTIEALDSNVDDENHDTKPTIKYKPNTPIGMLNTQVVRLALKNSTSKMAPTNIKSESRDSKINYSESFSNRVQNFNKMSGVSVVQICNDPDGFNKLSEDTKRIKSKSNFITSTLPPQVSGNWDNSSKQPMNTFRLQIHLPYEQLHVIRASPEYTIQDVLDIIHEERGLRLEKYNVVKTNEPDLRLDFKGTLKEYGITELTLKLHPEFEVIRNVNPKKVKKENSSHFRSAFKSFFHQLKPSSRSNSVTELRPISDTLRPKSAMPSITSTDFAKPKPPPRKRGQAPAPPPQNANHVGSGLLVSRSHTASESSCESMGEGSVGGSAPATLPRRCRLGPESVSTTNLTVEPPLPLLRRGVSDMAVNKPKNPRRKRAAPKPPAPIPTEELAEDGPEEQVFVQKTEPTSNSVTSSHIKAIDELNRDYHLDQNDRLIQKSNDIVDNVNQVLPNIDRTNILEKPLADNDFPSNHRNDRLILKDQSDHKEEFSPRIEEYSSQNEIIPIRNERQSVDNYEHTVYCEKKEIANERKFVSNSALQGHSGGEIINNTLNNVNQLDTCTVHDNEQQSGDTIQRDKDDQSVHLENGSNNDWDRSINVENETNHNVELLIKNENVTSQNEENVLSDDQLNHVKTSPIHKEENVDLSLNTAPPASQSARNHIVEHPVAVDISDFKLFPTNSRTVNSINNKCQSITPPLSKFNNKSRSTTLPLQRSTSSGSASVLKPTVDDLLKQIQIIKENKKVQQNQSHSAIPSMKESNDQQIYNVPNHYQMGKNIEQEVVHISKPQTTRIKLKAIYDNVNSEQLSSPVACVTPPATPTTEHNIPEFNVSATITEEGSSRLLTDAVNKLYSVEKQISEPGSAKSRPLPKFLLTSWAEEKHAPVVNRIADYGSRSSSTQVKGPTPGVVTSTVISPEHGNERPLPFSLTATLPRPFTKSAEITTGHFKSSTVNNVPTIINVIEKIKPNDSNDNNIAPYTHGRDYVYNKLNLYSMSPKILPNSHLDSHVNNENGVYVPTKPSWELVKDASKKLEEGTLNGDQVLSCDIATKTHDVGVLEKNNDINGKHEDDDILTKAQKSKTLENGAAMEQGVRHVYKYPKPLQFQLGTWTDKTKTLKINPEVNLGHKNDPPLVTELDEVAVWSATY